MIAQGQPPRLSRRA